MGLRDQRLERRGIKAMASTEPNTCETCGGDGLVGGSLCTECMGSGGLPARGLSLQFLYLKERFDAQPTSAQMASKFNDLQADLEEIKSGLQTIWNKVKDL